MKRAAALIGAGLQAPHFGYSSLPGYAVVARGLDPDDIHCVGYRVSLFGYEVRRLIERHELKAMCSRHFPKQVDAQAGLAQYIGDGHRRCQLADNFHLIGLNVAAIWNRIDRGCCPHCLFSSPTRCRLTDMPGVPAPVGFGLRPSRETAQGLDFSAFREEGSNGRID
ncbi:hypothetical protein WBQ28_25305 [Pseudomonas syringae pv. syringae]|uniref:hypothetical protein n=1 Tax=Pseudomonas syringae TaxID=317 RepID=UPI003B005D51